MKYSVTVFPWEDSLYCLSYFNNRLPVNNMSTIELKPGREKMALNFNPWIFSGAVKSVTGDPVTGEVVEVHDCKGNFIAKGHYSPESKIIVRLLDLGRDSVIDEAWYYEKIKKAAQLRSLIIDENSDAFRLIYSEGDFIPGLIVDRFGSIAVLQASSAGIDAVKHSLAEILMDMDKGILSVYEKSDGDGRRMEGLPVSKGLLAGKPVGESAEVIENAFRFSVNLSGQKTGFYSDQRENRMRTARYAGGREVLDICSYTGGFSIYALRGGAHHATLVDSSAEALKSAEYNMELNSIDRGDFTLLEGDAFNTLRRLKSEGHRFGLIILDPPKLAPSGRDREKALRGYKELNLQAMHLLEPGGILSTFSCSGHVTAPLFREAVTYAAKDAGFNMQILEQLSQAPDHPVRISLPETEYLKGLILRKQ